MENINFQEIFIVNGIGIALMLFVLGMQHENVQKRGGREEIFNTMVYLTIAANAAELLTFLIDGKLFPGCIVISYLLNSFCFLCSGMVGYLWCIYVNLRIFNSGHRLRKRKIFLMIPIFIIVAICLINLSGCGILFSISENNVYERGMLVMIVYVILYFYFIYSICLVDRSKTRGLYVQRFPTYYFVIPCMIGTAVQGLVYGVTLGWAAVAMALLFVYIQLQSMNALMDTLSGLYNRRYLDNILEHIRRDSKRTVYGVMMDVNGFKGINDNYGHGEGDDAIRNIGQILADSMPDCGIAIRYAGDEFILLLNTNSEDVVKDTIDRITSNVDCFNASKNGGYQLSLAIGYGRFDVESDDTDAFLISIDKQMYSSKKKYYEQQVSEDERKTYIE